MRQALISLLAVLLVGCSRGEYGEQDGRIVCGLDGKAYQVGAGVGDNSFLRRLSQADALCRKA